MDFLTDPFLVDPGQFDGPVLVTGAGGCIGSWTLAILVRSGVEVVAFDLRDDRRRPGMLLGEDAAAALTWETGDIADYDRLHQICAQHGVQAIVHLAGLMVPFCKASPAAGARVNVEGTINVLELARAQGLTRLAYASSSAIHGMPPGGPHISTLYGAYKLANEYTAKVYWLDWQVPSVGLRPNVVYGVGRDLGMTSSYSVGLAHAVQGQAFQIPYGGPLSWLYAGEAASAFIAAVSRDGEGAHVFDLNGTCMSIEAGLDILGDLMPEHQITTTGDLMPVPADLCDDPVRAHLGDYPSVLPRDGIAQTVRAFQSLHAANRLSLPS